MKKALKSKRFICATEILSKYDPQYLRYYFENRPDLGPTLNLRIPDHLADFIKTRPYLCKEKLGPNTLVSEKPRFDAYKAKTTAYHGKYLFCFPE